MQNCCYKTINRYAITKRVYPETEPLVIKEWRLMECGVCGNRMSAHVYIHISNDSDKPGKPLKRNKNPKGPKADQRVNMGKKLHENRVPKDIWQEYNEEKGVVKNG